MIIISLDEGGRFEQLTRPQCMLIGGLVFQCGSEADMKQEMRSLENFFKTMCAEQGGSYPTDLHPIWDAGGNVINADSMGKTKKALSTEMGDYLQKRGRWANGRPQKGSYYTFCMVGDQKGLDDHSAGNLRDNIATVRYDHMIYRTIENILMYNPQFRNEKEIKLDLPTRVINLNDKGINRESLKAELEKLGYRRRRNKDGSFDENVYEVTDETSFRTCLESALLNTDRSDLQFDLNVQSINYKKPQFYQMFLYLADTLCSVYQDTIYGMKTNAAALPALKEKCGKLTRAEKNMLWAYHPVDQKWRTIWNDYSNANWFEALTAAWEIRTSRGAVEKVYGDTWIQWFEKVLVAEKDFSALSEAVFKLDQYMLDMETRKQGTGMYIMNLLKENYQLIENEKERGRLEYRISKIITGLYNHHGDYAKAQAEYKKCMAAARYVPIEEFLGLQLLHSVSLCDAQKYEEAENVAATLVTHHELLNDIKTEVYPDNRMVYDSYGRALSQHGQCYSFLGRYEESIERFEEALEIFEEKSRDWRVTGSYLLHTLIEKEDAGAYKAKAKEYFGAASVKKQFSNIIDGKCGKASFALYVFLKGLWLFGGTETDPAVIREMIEKIKEAQKADDPSHPWEQVMKYCAFLQCRYFEKNEKHEGSEELMAIGRATLQKPEGILKVIAEENEKQYRLVIQGKDWMDGSKVNYTYR